MLGQLVDEGRIDVEAKSFALEAIERQSEPEVLEYANERLSRLKAIAGVIRAA